MMRNSIGPRVHGGYLWGAVLAGGGDCSCSLFYKSKLFHFHNYVYTSKRTEKNKKLPHGEVYMYKINNSSKDRIFYTAAYLMFF